MLGFQWDQSDGFGSNQTNLMLLGTQSDERFNQQGPNHQLAGSQLSLDLRSEKLDCHISGVFVVANFNVWLDSVAF